MVKIFGHDKQYKQVNIGIKKGEKLHEELVTEEESQNIDELNNLFVVKPGTPVPAKKRYLLRSSDPEYLISEEEIIKYINQMLKEQM
jgi:FlaA1/EpsC-like NDP-sugar epimerase